jgi:hypothetical protein
VAHDQREDQLGWGTARRSPGMSSVPTPPARRGRAR